MKLKQVIIPVIIVFNIALTGCENKLEKDGRQQLIIDTDFGAVHGDIDDMGAIAVAHGLMNNDECDLKAVILCINNGHAMQAVDAVNTYFGRGDIPVANTDGELIYGDTSFAYHVAVNFENDIVPEEALPATKLYRKLLAEAEKNSIRIAVIGHPGNLYNLFKSEADEYSDLNGIELVRAKVDTLYIMGGNFPVGRNPVNFKYAGECVTKDVIENCPVPIVFQGGEIGRMSNGFIAGSKLNQLPDSNPVKACFQYWFKYPVNWYHNPSTDSIRDHNIWDEITIHTAVRGVQNWFELETNGSCKVECNGFNTWDSTENKDHAYMKVKMDPKYFSETYIEPLMMALPIKDTIH